MRHVLPLYHVSGTRADENRVISSRRCAGGSLNNETETFTYPLSNLEETDEEEGAQDEQEGDEECGMFEAESDLDMEMLCGECDEDDEDDGAEESICPFDFSYYEKPTPTARAAV